MRFHASTERACRTAKRLRDIVNLRHPSPVPLLLGTAQRALAAAWGYASWTELTAYCESAPRSPLDEDSDADLVAGRAAYQAEALARTLDIDMALAMAVVAEAGLTARTPPATHGPGSPAPVSDIVDGTAFERIMARAMSSGPRQVAFHAGEPVTATGRGGDATLTAHRLSQAEVDDVVAHLYGRRGLFEARAGHDLKPEVILDWALDLGPAPSGWPGYKPHVTHRGTRVTCDVAETDAAGRPVGRTRVGRIVGTGDEATFSQEAMLQHLSVLGGTRQARTALLRDLLSQAIADGRGCILVDAGGDASAISAARDLAARHGRGADVLAVDMCRQPSSDGTLDPFVSMDGPGLAVLLSRLRDAVGDRDDVWQGRADAMLLGVARALVHLRDHHGLGLDASALRSHLGIGGIIGLADPGTHPDMPAETRRSLRSYLSSLPGFRPEWGAAQCSTTLDQHAYLEDQFTKVLDAWADNAPLASMAARIDMADVIMGGRILVVSLPREGKSRGEVAALGGVVLATLGAAMGSILTAQAERARRIKRAGGPFHVLVDGLGRYPVRNPDLWAAQARLLGMAVAYISDDLESLPSAHERQRGGPLGDGKVVLRMADEASATAAVSYLRGHGTRAGTGDPAPGDVPLDDWDARTRWPGSADLLGLADDEACVAWPDGTAHLVRLRDAVDGAQP